MKGKIIKHEDKKLLVFGTAVIPRKFVEGFFDSYHIGINLGTGKVDDIEESYPTIVDYTNLSKDELKTFAKGIEILLEVEKNVVTISAKARSGKDTLAKSLADKTKAFVVPLGAPIYAVRDIVYGKPPEGDKDRPSLIAVGQGLRGIDPNVWIKAWLRTVVNNPREYFICPDVRQPNEFSFFDSLGAFKIGIKADEEKRLEFIRKLDGESALSTELLKDETESHSESFECDLVLNNDYDSSFDFRVVQDILPLLRKRGW